MKITKDNLHLAIAALRQCAKENENRQTDTGAVRVTDLCNDVADYLEKDKDKARKDEVKTVNKLTGLGPVSYVLVREGISKEEEQDYLSRIDIVVPHDSNDEEKTVLRFLVLKYAPKILADTSDEQTRRTERMILHEWMNCFGTYYRDSHNQVTIERGGEKVRVVFTDKFIYD